MDDDALHFCGRYCFLLLLVGRKKNLHIVQKKRQTIQMVHNF